MSVQPEVIEVTAGEIAEELKRRGISSDEKVTLTIEPAMIAVVVVPGVVCRQNRLPPQREQKPRSALSDERYQRSVSAAISARSAFCAMVAVTKLPLVRRHCEQWQAITSRNGPRT